MWAITCYFNPVGYQRRLSNFRAFRQKLQVPLVAVELAYGPAFDLQPGDAEILIQLRGGDVLWQGERLLNVALRAVPQECQQVAWLDCDLLFENSDWPRAAGRLLENFALVQLFQQIAYLPVNASIDAPHLGHFEDVRTSYAFRFRDAGLLPDEAAARGARLPGAWLPVPGGGFAFRREVFEKRGFYDVHVVGGGDAAMLWAAFGQFESVVRRMQMKERQRDHYLCWGKSFFDAVRGSVSYVPGRVFHMWHGQQENRRYRQRHDYLGAHDFDPCRDIALDQSGCWRWNSDKPQMHDRVREYFLLRKEDG